MIPVLLTRHLICPRVLVIRLVEYFEYVETKEVSGPRIADLLTVGGSISGPGLGAGKVMRLVLSRRVANKS